VAVVVVIFKQGALAVTHFIILQAHLQVLAEQEGLVLTAQQVQVEALQRHGPLVAEAEAVAQFQDRQLDTLGLLEP
jgi:hypothetical protein